MNLEKIITKITIFLTKPDYNSSKNQKTSKHQNVSTLILLYIATYLHLTNDMNFKIPRYDSTCF